MPITKQKKEEVIVKLRDILKNAKSVTFANFHGLNVSEATKMRKELRDVGVGYYVAKKTLVKRAFSDSKVSGDVPELAGELGVAFSSDEVASSREIYSFQKKFEERISILGGIFEGKFRNKAEMTEIASIPSIQILRGMFVNVINSPIQGLVVALSKVAEQKTA
ncbi:MAG: 50S ribosomal protein L10 [bacterium]|nr:50S ribosomal protein L10 [bacterium]